MERDRLAFGMVAAGATVSDELMYGLIPVSLLNPIVLSTLGFELGLKANRLLGLGIAPSTRGATLAMNGVF